MNSLWIVLFIIVLVLIYYYYYTNLKKEETDDPPSSSSGETLESKYPSDPTQLTILLNSKERTVATLSSTMPDSPRITELQQEIEEIKALLNNSTSSAPINIETPKDLLDYIISESDKLETTYQIIKQNAEGLSDIRTSSDVPALVSKLNTMFNYSVVINNYFTSMLPSLVKVSKDKDIENIRECIGIICMNVSQIISILYHDNIMVMFSVYNEILPKNVASMNAADKTSAMITYLNSIKTIVLNHANNYQLYINVMNSLVDIDSTSSSLSDFISANISDMYKVVKEDLDELTSFILSFDKNEYNVVISDVVTKISEYKVANDKFKEYTDKEYNIDRNINYSGLGSSNGSSGSSLSLDAFLGIDPNKESIEYNIPGEYTQKTGEPNTRYFIRGKYYGPPGKLYIPFKDTESPPKDRYLNAGYRADKEEDAGIIIEPIITPEGYPVTKYEIKDDKLEYEQSTKFTLRNNSTSTYKGHGVCIINKMALYNIHGERILVDKLPSNSPAYSNIADDTMLKETASLFSPQSYDVFKLLTTGYNKPVDYAPVLKDNDFLYVTSTVSPAVSMGILFDSAAAEKLRPYTIVLAYNKKLIEKYMDLNKFKKTMDTIMGSSMLSELGITTMLGGIQDLNEDEIGYVIQTPVHTSPGSNMVIAKNTVVPHQRGLNTIPGFGNDTPIKNAHDDYKEKYLVTNSIPIPIDAKWDKIMSFMSFNTISHYMFPVFDKKDGMTLTINSRSVSILSDIAALFLINRRGRHFSYSKILRYTTIFPDSDLVMPLTDKVFYKNYNTKDGGLCIDEVQPDDIVLPSHEILLDVMTVKKKKANLYTFVVYDALGYTAGTFRILNYYNNNQKIQYVLVNSSGHKILNQN